MVDVVGGESVSLSVPGLQARHGILPVGSKRAFVHVASILSIGLMQNMQDIDKDDAALVRMVLSGDKDAFGILVERHSQAIHQQMRNYSRDLRISEELAHDVFVEAFMCLGKYRGDAPFYNWLSRIATFTGCKHWKSRDRKKGTVEFSEERDWVQSELQSGGKDPEQAKRLAYDLLAALPDNDRIVLTLSYLENCSHDEIAERLGWRKSLIAMRIFKAKGKLRKLAEKEPWKGKVRWMIS